MARTAPLTEDERKAVVEGLVMLLHMGHLDADRQQIVSGLIKDFRWRPPANTGPRVKGYVINAGTPGERIDTRLPEGDSGITVYPIGIIDPLSPEARERLQRAVDKMRGAPAVPAQPRQGQGLTDTAKAVIDAARAAMDESIEANDGLGGIILESDHAAALSLRLDEYDRGLKLAQEGGAA